MLLEDHVQDTDPDETDAAITFDAAAAAQPGGKKTSQWAMFNKLKVAGGGWGCPCSKGARRPVHQRRACLIVSPP